MSETIDFRKRVVDVVSFHAPLFRSAFVEYEYLVCSPAFKIYPYYIIASKEDNYMHLTGVPYPKPQEFFEKCMNRTLQETDISFTKRGQAESAVKGSIRRKIKVLPNLVTIFQKQLTVQEAFCKNHVVCSFGTSDSTCTIGFTLVSGTSLKVHPMTLLSGNELSQAFPVELILRRKAGDDLFDTLIIGNTEILDRYRERIAFLLAKEL